MRSPSRHFVSRLSKNRLGIVGLVCLLLIVTLAVTAPLLSRYSPLTNSYGEIFQPPSQTHWLGTDGLGRDIATRVAYGGRTTLGLALLIAVLQTVVGGTLGLVAGGFGRTVDLVLQRVVEIQLAIPDLIGMMLVILITGERSALGLILALTIFGWAPASRLVRGEVLALREEEFVLAARAIGVPTWRMFMECYMINVVPILIVYVTINTAFNILLIATLSFLGYGLPSSHVGWGVMLQDATSMNILTRKPWVWIPPGMAIAMSVISVNFVGEALRDALDPKFYHRG